MRGNEGVQPKMGLRFTKKKCINYLLLAIIFIGVCVLCTNTGRSSRLDVNMRASHAKAQKQNETTTLKKVKDTALNEKASEDDIAVKIKKMSTRSMSKVKANENDFIVRVQSNDNPANGDMLKKVDGIALNGEITDDGGKTNAKGSENDAVKKSKSQAKLDPLLQQQQDTQRSLEHVRAIAKDLPSFITFEPERHSLTYTELEERMVPMLEKGLVLVGDSTSRILFGFLWCLMEGYYRSGEKDGDMLCQEIQDDLRRQCGGIIQKGCKGFHADFTNRTGLSLQFEANFHLGAPPGSTQRALTVTSSTYVYFGMPCLHQLWSPGPRESVGLPSLSDWEEKFQTLFSFIVGLTTGNRPKVPMIGLSVAVCDEKMPGSERELIKAYLQKEHLQGYESSAVRAYNYLYRNNPTEQLPLNYSGPVPIRESYHVNRTFNHDMLNENGAVHCSLTGLLLLQKLAKKQNWNPIVLDIHGATASSCNDTSDGRHYHGHARRRQISLLLEGAMIQQATRTIERPVPHRRESLDIRSNRFPSVEERVKLYMSNWYVPPCPGNVIRVKEFTATGVAIQEITTTIQAAKKEMGRILLFKSEVQMDDIFFLDRPKLRDCIENPPVPPALNYCQDVQATVLPALDRVGDNGTTPVLIQFGDSKVSHSEGYVNLPVIKKIRSVATQASLSNVTLNRCYSGPRDPLHTKHDKEHFQPILWKLNRNRHYSMIPKVRENDIAWSLKKNMAVFRGTLTGVSRIEASLNSNFDVCMNSLRCRLVFRHANSTLVDARITDTFDLINNTINGVKVTEKLLDMKEQLQYKALIMVEGNDVATGLKWALLSNSVVMMQPPSHTSWAMEELLEPWVHYVPLNEKLSDVEEKMQWVLDNDKEAQLIAQRGTLWIHDLVLHPDASNDDKRIQDEIIRRYRAHFLGYEERAVPA